MMILSEDQLNSLNREALIIIVASLQDQLASVQSQLDTANTQLADTNRQIELLTEQIRIMNQRHFGRQAESNLTEGQLTRKGQILRSTPNTAPLICGACNTQPEGLSTMA